MNIQQQTPEWHEMRKNHLGASDAPVVMEVSPWKTPFQLWEEKIGLSKDEQRRAAMQRGLDLEPKAREKFESMTGLLISPAVKKHPSIDFMMASFDGIDLSGDYAVEIKCPGKEDHEMAKSGEVPEKYIPQLQHQLEVCQLGMLYYFSFDGEEGVILEVQRDDGYIHKMIRKEKEFWDCVQELIAPKMTERDYQKIADVPWGSAAQEWVMVSKQLKELEEKEKALRDNLIAMARGQNAMGNGIKVSKTIRKGNIDYSRVPQLDGVDLEQYRKNPVEYWRISGG